MSNHLVPLLDKRLVALLF